MKALMHWNDALGSSVKVYLPEQGRIDEPTPFATLDFYGHDECFEIYLRPADFVSFADAVQAELTKLRSYAAALAEV